MMAERDGVHCTSTLKLVRRRPSLAIWSSRGVAAPRMIPPPLKPGSPQPKLSMNTRTMLGLSWALATMDVVITQITTSMALVVRFIVQSPPLPAVAPTLVRQRRHGFSRGPER